MSTEVKIIGKVDRQTPPRQKLWAMAELLVAAALVVGANVFDVVPISETPWLVALGWLSLRRRGLTWRTLGLATRQLDRHHRDRASCCHCPAAAQ